MNYVCTNCGHVGVPQDKNKGNIAIEVVLWLFFIVPGLIYSLWRLASKEEICPICKKQTMIPATTPVGQQLVGGLAKTGSQEPVNPQSDDSSLFGKRVSSKGVSQAFAFVIGLVVLLIVIALFI